jgi:CubicO group peptidase (beta-lactamase class C family)
MRLRTRFAVLAGCVACLVLGAVSPGRAAGAAEVAVAAAVDRAAGEAFAATGLPGMALTVTRGSQVVLVKGFGTAGAGKPVTTKTQFRIASLSKSFTATAVLQLVEAGTVDLDAPVRRYLPELTLADGNAEKITVRQLLNQTSGLADAGIADDGSTATTLADRVAGLRTSRTVSAPGTRFHYVDANYQILARMVELVAGVRFAGHLRRKVLDPLGMTRTLTTTTAQQAPDAAPDLARGHILLFGVPVAKKELHGFVEGSSGVVSTAGDMARWLIAQSGGGPRIIGPASLATMQTPPAGIDTTYAMGWTRPDPATGPPRLQHFGVLGTFSADQALLPASGYGFALLYDGSSALADITGVENAVAAALSGEDPGGTFPRTLVVAALFGVLTIGTVVLRGRAALRLRGWAEKRCGTSGWRLAPNLVWLVLPAGVLAATPALVLAFAGRRFSWPQLLLSMPDAFAWLGVSAVTGLALAGARVAALVRVRRTGRRAGAEPGSYRSRRRPR